MGSGRSRSQTMQARSTAVQATAGRPSGDQQGREAQRQSRGTSCLIGHTSHHVAKIVAAPNADRILELRRPGKAPMGLFRRSTIGHARVAGSDRKPLLFVQAWQ